MHWSYINIIWQTAKLSFVSTQRCTATASFLCKLIVLDLVLPSYRQVCVNRFALFVEIREESWHNIGTIGDKWRIQSTLYSCESHKNCLSAPGLPRIISVELLTAMYANTFNVDDDPDKQILPITMQDQSTAIWIIQHVDNLPGNKSEEK